jgi:hypothetical protein
LYLVERPHRCNRCDDDAESHAERGILSHGFSRDFHFGLPSPLEHKDYTPESSDLADAFTFNRFELSLSLSLRPVRAARGPETAAAGTTVSIAAPRVQVVELPTVRGA